MHRCGRDTGTDDHLYDSAARDDRSHPGGGEHNNDYAVYRKMT